MRQGSWQQGRLWVARHLGIGTIEQERESGLATYEGAHPAIYSWSVPLCSHGQVNTRRQYTGAVLPQFLGQDCPKKSLRL